MTGAGTVAIITDPSQRWDWIDKLAEQLASRGLAATLVESSTRQPLGAAFDALEMLETALFGLGARRFATRSPHKDTLASAAAAQGRIVLDVSGAAKAAPGQICLRFDGGGYAELIGALIDRRAPRMTLERDGACIASARPAIDDLTVLGRAIEQVFAATLDLCATALDESSAHIWSSEDHGTPLRRASWVNARLMAAGARELQDKVKGRILSLSTIDDHWKVGWRDTDAAASVQQTGLLSGRPFQYIPDDRQRFLADPFAFVHGDRRYIFVEEFPYATGKGLISVIDLSDPRLTPVPVLEQPFHLSYPNVFRHDGQIFMLPETMANRTVELWRAADFPWTWERHGVLLDGVDAVDPTLHITPEGVWLFAAVRPEGASACYRLQTWFATSIDAQFRAVGPILADARHARPAGQIYRRGGQLWRPAQDCSQRYGGAIALCRIERLDIESGLSQTPVARIAPPVGMTGLHTLNRDATLEVIDVCGRARRRANPPQSSH